MPFSSTKFSIIPDWSFQSTEKKRALTEPKHWYNTRALTMPELWWFQRIDNHSAVSIPNRDEILSDQQRDVVIIFRALYWRLKSRRRYSLKGREQSAWTVQIYSTETARWGGGGTAGGSPPPPTPTPNYYPALHGTVIFFKHFTNYGWISSL